LDETVQQTKGGGKVEEIRISVGIKEEAKDLLRRSNRKPKMIIRRKFEDIWQHIFSFLPIKYL
jgi:hypothetical protein